METASEARKRQRGTKRICRACEQRFYDLGRDPSICPMCHTSLPLSLYAPPAAAPSGYHGSWASRRAPVRPVLPVEEEIVAIPGEAVVEEAAGEEAPAAEDDTILEQEAEEEIETDVNLLTPDDEARPEE